MQDEAWTNTITTTKFTETRHCYTVGTSRILYDRVEHQRLSQKTFQSIKSLLDWFVVTPSSTAVSYRYNNSSRYKNLCRSQNTEQVYWMFVLSCTQTQHMAPVLLGRPT